MSALSLDEAYADAAADTDTEGDEGLAPPLADLGAVGGHKTISFFGARCARARAGRWPRAAIASHARGRARRGFAVPALSPIPCRGCAVRAPQAAWRCSPTT
jgi:hypothetical protein